MRFARYSPRHLSAEHENKIKGLKETSKQSANTSSGYSTELNVQNVSYLMVISSCSEKKLETGGEGGGGFFANLRKDFAEPATDRRGMT